MKYAVTILIILIAFSVKAQVNWMTTVEVQEAYKKEAKPIILFIHTDWCKICKMQEESVFMNDSLSKSINKNFYSINLNAEDQKNIQFFGRNYKGASVNNHHELATYLGNAEKTMSFPTTVLLNEQFELVFRKSGLVSKEEFWKMLKSL